MQLVLSNNRILSHGENFLSMGGVVINTETGAKYENATIAECECLPSDINTVGYEYHAGNFVPCAPFGVGNGNIPVLCNIDCKSIKDSEIPLGRMAQIVETSYNGSGGDVVVLSFDAIPKIVYISSVEQYNNTYFAILTDGRGISWSTSSSGINHIASNFDSSDGVSVDGKKMTIRTKQDGNINRSGVHYRVTAIIQGGE